MIDFEFRAVLRELRRLTAYVRNQRKSNALFVATRRSSALGKNVAQDFGSDSTPAVPVGGADSAADSGAAQLQTDVYFGIRETMEVQRATIDSKIDDVSDARRTIKALIGDNRLDTNISVVDEDQLVGELIKDLDIAKRNACSLLADSGSPALSETGPRKHFNAKHDLFESKLAELFEPASDAGSEHQPVGVAVYAKLQAAAEAAEKNGRLSPADVGNITQAIGAFRSTLEAARESIEDTLGIADGVSKRFDAVGPTKVDLSALRMVVSRGRDAQQRMPSRRSAALQPIDPSAPVAPTDGAAIWPPPVGSPVELASGDDAADSLPPLTLEQVGRATESWVSEVKSDLGLRTRAAERTATRLAGTVEAAGLGHDRGVTDSISKVRRTLHELPVAVSKLEMLVGRVLEGHQKPGGLTDEQKAHAKQQLSSIDRALMNYHYPTSAPEEIVLAITRADLIGASLDDRFEGQYSSERVQLGDLSRVLGHDLAQVRNVQEVRIGEVAALIDGNQGVLEEFAKRAEVRR